MQRQLSSFDIFVIVSELQNIIGYQVEKSRDDILNLPETIGKKKNIQFIICIDEFQGIMRLRDHLNFENELRNAWQYHKHASYCLFGSKRHMMKDIFRKCMT